MSWKKALFVTPAGLVTVLTAASGYSAVDAGDVQRVKDFKQRPNCDPADAYIPNESLNGAAMKKRLLFRGPFMRFARICRFFPRRR